MLFGQIDFVNLIAEPTQPKANNGNLATSFTTSLFAILATEVGDKTFFLAMIMAMKYNKVVVFSGAFAALAVMTVVSAVSGKVIFSFLPKIYTDIAVTVLFFYFGGKLIY
jgi:Ca2+/H+ antiporter, TMEM165/GDT1 family